MTDKVVQLASLVGNRTCYAVQKPDGSYFPVQDVTPQQFEDAIKKHIAGEHTIGTYVIDGDKARTLVFDVDSGDDAKGEIVKLRKALSSEFGFAADQQGVEFSGNKGFHIWVVFPVFVSANHLRRMGRYIATVAEVDCEVFPKQDSAVQLGNLVKLPEGIHQKTKKPNNFLTPFPRAVTKAQYEAAVAKLPEEKRFTGGQTEAFPCLTKIQEGVCEGGRNNALYHALVMFRRNGLNGDNLWLVAEQINNKFDPPLDDGEYQRTVESALRGGGPICNTLGDDMHCGEICVTRREKGLYVRPRQLQYGAEGEVVVVQIGKRDGNVIELAHPDLEVSKAKVRDKQRKT